LLDHLTLFSKVMLYLPSYSSWIYTVSVIGCELYSCPYHW